MYGIETCLSTVYINASAYTLLLLASFVCMIIRIRVESGLNDLCITVLMGQVDLICKPNYLDVTQLSQISLV